MKVMCIKSCIPFYYAGKQYEIRREFVDNSGVERAEIQLDDYTAKQVRTEELNNCKCDFVRI